MRTSRVSFAWPTHGRAGGAAAGGGGGRGDRVGGVVLTDPDMLSADCSTVTAGDPLGNCELRLVIGPVYETADGDSLAAVAAQYRTTVKSLLLVNADLVATLPDSAGPASALPAGTAICVLPCTL